MKKWTIQEDELLIKKVKTDFGNLQEAFRELSKTTLIGRTPSAISKRWYRVLSNPNNKRHTKSSCFLLVAECKNFSNRKNYRKALTQNQAPSIWDTILNILKKE